MIRQSPAKIFLSDQRLLRQSGVHRSFSTLSYGAHEHTRTSDLWPLFVLNDEELAGAGSVTIPVLRACYMILLPITGDLHITGTETGKHNLTIGELKVLYVPANAAVTLSNPFPYNTINYLQLCIEAEETPAASALYQFDLDANGNELIRMSNPSSAFSISIGRFSGRNEGLYPLRNRDSSLFCFVIAGAFEVEHRLLQLRDGLEIHDIDKLEFEALSEDAVLLLIELFASR